MDKPNLDIVRRNFGNIVYTQWVHEVSSERQLTLARILKALSIGLVICVLITALIQIANLDKPIWSYIGSGLSVIEIMLLLVQLTFKPDDISAEHKKAALKLIQLREQYLGLMADILNESLTAKEVMQRRDHLAAESQHIYANARPTSRRAFRIVQKRLNPKGIVDGEDFTFTAEEINRFLPESLHFPRKPKKP